MDLSMMRDFTFGGEEETADDTVEDDATSE